MRVIEVPDEVPAEVVDMLHNILRSVFDKQQDMRYNDAIVKDLCIKCPHCNRKLQPIEHDTTAYNFPMKCRRCGKFFKVNI